MVSELTSKHPVTLVNSINPYRIEGQKTGAFEIIETLGDAPDFVFIPVGNAGNITAYWKGFVEYHKLGKATKKPTMMGFQAAGAAPIVLGHPLKNRRPSPPPSASATPPAGKRRPAARDESGGLIDMVTDDEILAAYHLLAEKAGIFGEPASAAPLAGLLKLSRARARTSPRLKSSASSLATG